MTTEITDRQFEIIEAAGRILTTSGVGGLTTKNLAREMQFSESAIYRHFKNKEEIIIALLDYLAGNMNERLTWAVSEAQNPDEKFRSLFINQLSFFAKHPYFVVAVFSDGLMEESQKINATMLKIMQVKIKHLMPVIMQGQQQGYFTNAVTTEEIIHIVMGSFRLQMYKWRIANFQFDIERQGKHMLEAMMVLIKN